MFAATATLHGSKLFNNKIRHSKFNFNWCWCLGLIFFFPIVFPILIFAYVSECIKKRKKLNKIKQREQFNKIHIVTTNNNHIEEGNIELQDQVTRLDTSNKENEN